MEKNYLVSILEKCYLSGLIEKIKLDIKNKNIEIKCVSSNKNLIAIINASNFEIEDSEIGIFDLEQLLKLINITDIMLDVKLKEERGVITKLLISDTKYNLEYSLAQLSLIHNPPKSIEEPIYDISLEFDSDFIPNFLKAKKAQKDIFTLQIETHLDSESRGQVKFIIGEEGNFGNKIDLSSTGEVGIPGVNIKFPLEEFTGIIENNSDFKENKIFISSEGFMKLSFISNDDINSTYFLVGKD